jgi:hypothetical protein
LSYTDQLGLKERQKLQNEYQVVQQKWKRKMKKQTLNLKELTVIHLTLEHFLPQIIKINFTSILIRTDNTTAMYGINWKTHSQNLYMTTRRIWYLIDQNEMALKAIHKSLFFQILTWWILMAGYFLTLLKNLTKILV